MQTMVRHRLKAAHAAANTAANTAVRLFALYQNGGVSVVMLGVNPN